MTSTEDSRPPYLSPEDLPPGLPSPVLSPQSLRELATPAAPKGRRLPGRRATVTLLDPATEDLLEPFEVRIDNRDYLRWDQVAQRQKWGSGKDVPFLMATYLAWSAAVRTGQTTLKWEQFQATAVEVENHDDKAEDEARPTE